MNRRPLALALAALLSTTAGAAVASDGGFASATPKFDPSAFVRRVDNPWFPLRPGTTLRYRGVKDGKPSVDVLAVTHRTKRILGVRATVVHDRLYLDGRLEETTSDWYAQDRAGNVWYLGERTAELDAAGKVRSTEGSWQAGVRGARAGIFMPVHPRVGDSGLQEYYKGHAEDRFTVISLHASVRVPAVSSRQALETRELTRLEPGVVDHKFYVRGIGTVLEQTVKGGDERNELVSITRR